MIKISINDKVSKVYPYSAYSLYRRDSDPFIRQEFNNYGYDKSELSVNQDVLAMIMYTFGEAKNGEGIHAWEVTKNTDFTGAPYWSLTTDRSSAVTISLLDFLMKDRYVGKYPDFWEFKLDVGVFGPGMVTVYVSNDRNIDGYNIPVDNKPGQVERLFGPTSWQISDYHFYRNNQYIQVLYSPKGESDPIPRAEIDNLVFYGYHKVDTEFVKLGPFRSDSSPKKLEVIQGFTGIQTISRISSTADVQLRFYSRESYLDFISHAEYPHVIIDESNIRYRGVFDLQEDEHYGSGLHEIKAKYYSPYKLGVGWV